jgi:glutathione S-transferase
MPDFILHHYPLSPFSEKVRLALGLKRLDYHSVTIPIWMPKPELMPLTGGYRRTPVMQVGADIFCDTLLILHEIERLHPSPTLYPGGTEGLATALGWWAEKFTFMPAVGLVVSLVGEHFPRELIEERKPFFGFSIDKDAMQAQQPLFVQRLNAHLGWLGQMLHDGRDFLLGPSQAPRTSPRITRSGSPAGTADPRLMRCCRRSRRCGLGMTASARSDTAIRRIYRRPRRSPSRGMRRRSRRGRGRRRGRPTCWAAELGTR